MKKLHTPYCNRTTFYRYSETKTLAGVRMNEIQHIPQLATPQPATTNTTPKLQLTNTTCSLLHTLLQLATAANRSLYHKYSRRLGAAFNVTVKPKDLPECWGVRFRYQPVSKKSPTVQPTN